MHGRWARILGTLCPLFPWKSPSMVVGRRQRNLRNLIEPPPTPPVDPRRHPPGPPHGSALRAADVHCDSNAAWWPLGGVRPSKGMCTSVSSLEGLPPCGVPALVLALVLELELEQALELELELELVLVLELVLLLVLALVLVMELLELELEQVLESLSTRSRPMASSSSSAEGTRGTWASSSMMPAIPDTFRRFGYHCRQLTHTHNSWG